MSVLDEISRAVDERGKEFIALSDQIWDNPELRWNEFASIAAQIQVAERAGFTIQRQVAGIPTAFSAEYGTGGPVIAILGEYDSLAGLSQESGVAARQPDPATRRATGKAAVTTCSAPARCSPRWRWPASLTATACPGGSATTAARPRRPPRARPSWSRGAPSPTSTPR